ncbi:MAG: septal ring lytic transglycosylase RlpA family protein [Gammaproteobacteria bacterium]|nr:septal ring lytic transglycosylase RlpA family protein [Gammaproteobacteria bacterium]
MKYRKSQRISIIVSLGCVLLLGGCAGNQVMLTASAATAGGKSTETGYGENGRGNKSPYTVFGKSYTVMPESLGYLEIGIASWYGREFHGRLTSNGETFNMLALTAAHKSLPLPSYVKVTNLDNRRHTIVKVNDRGPFHDDRLIDLSYQAAMELGFADKGTAPVVVEAVDAMNYPGSGRNQLQALSHKNSYYLQIGVFSRRGSAEALLARVERLVSSSDLAMVKVQILESEQKTSILHKVWVGPLGSEMQRDELAALVEAAQLGRPLKVEID